MTSTNEFHENCPPEMKSWLCPWCNRWWLSRSPTVWHKRDCCKN